MTCQTPHLLLLPATAALLRLELSGTAAFGQALGAEVPSNWPPEALADALPWFSSILENSPALAGWLCWYGVTCSSAGAPPLLVASGGFTGLPILGSVEIGYSVLPQFQGRGYATEMVDGLVEWALAQPDVHMVTAEVHCGNAASVRVLTKARFLQTGTAKEAGYYRFTRSRACGI